MRVIAGTARGHTLRVPKVDGLRPTSDRARESLFNVLAPIIEGARVLDVFAGSGALGIEALSRGAAAATFVERSRRARDVMAENVDRCGFTERSTIILGDWRAALRRLGKRLQDGVIADVRREGSAPRRRADARFHVALFDPPYDWDRPHLCLTALTEDELLAEDGLAIIEHRSSARVEAPSGWNIERVLRVGDSSFSICRQVAGK